MPMSRFRAAVAGLTGAMIVFGAAGVMAQGDPSPTPKRTPSQHPPRRKAASASS